MPKDQMEVIRKIVYECMNIKPPESVLIVADHNKLELCKLFLYEIEKITDAALIISKPTKVSGEEPINLIAEALLYADVALLITTKSLTHTNAVREALKKGRLRAASMPGITEDMLSSGGLLADYKEVERITRSVAEKLNGAKEVRITTALGTDLMFSIENRVLFLDIGFYHKSKDIGNLPAGEVYVAPVEGSANGTLIVDGAMHGKISKPIRMEIKDGKVAEIKGDKEAENLKKIIDEADENAVNIAEFGIGTNPAAVLIGNVLEDEKVLGTIHIAIGNNKSMAGSVYSKIHIDGVVKKPNVWIDGKKIMEEGILIKNNLQKG